jgi:hypothetical protein
LAEKAGRLKPNGYVVSRSPLSDVLELETLRAAVEGKAAGWQLLKIKAQSDPVLSTSELETLIARARAQADQLRELHHGTASENWRRAWMNRDQSSHPG